MGARISLHVREDPAIQLSTTDGGSSIGLVSDAIVVTDTTDYEELENKPSIEGNVLIGDKALRELGITADNMGLDELIEDVTPLSNLDIDSLFS